MPRYDAKNITRSKTGDLRYLKNLIGPKELIQSIFTLLSTFNNLPSPIRPILFLAV